MILTLVLWLASLIAGGAMAAALFPWMKQLEPVLPGFSAYSGEHWKLGAGLIAQRFFAAGDMAQLVCACLCVVCHALVMIDERGRASPAKREMFAQSALVGVPWLLVAYEVFILGPRMTANFRSLVAAARAGDNDAARVHQSAFSSDHPTATMVLVSTACAVLVLLMFRVVMLTRKGLAADHAR